MSNMLQEGDRRSANYHPSIWAPEVIKSLSTPYTYDFYATQLQKLKLEVKSLLQSTKDNPCLQLKLIDSMQRLGVAYHFEEEIKKTISSTELDVTWDVYTTALHFRLLRVHALPVSSDVFNKFRNENGKFMDNLSRDIAGLLSLYEASHLGEHGEDVLEEAKNFSAENLQSFLMKIEQSNSLAKQVQQSLELPLHWRMSRIETRNYIDIYQMDDKKILLLLELAKLDYNLVQSVYQRELKELARWWTGLGFAEKLCFSRDRLMENYLWAVGMSFEPQASKFRTGLTKFICILTVIDDMYDIYGSLDELQLFTDAVNRWDIKAMDDLPEYMKICYFEMFNFANELAYDVLKDHGLDVLTYIKEEWTNLCRSYLVEARWFGNAYIPTLDEYLENAWISVGGPSAFFHAYMLAGCSISENSLNCFKLESKLIYWSSRIARLSNDLGTSMAESTRGDVAKSIRCYMTEKSVSEEQAKDHINMLISYSWKKLNQEAARKSLPESLTNISLNVARTAQCIFQHGDGIGTSTGLTKDRLRSLIVDPIPI